MELRLVRRPLFLCVAAAIGALGVAGCAAVGGGTDRRDGAATSPASSSAGVLFNDADIAFAQHMIPHHLQAVEMADLAATRAADPEVRTLATQIKSAQTPEIAMMTGWLAGWGGHTFSPTVHGAHGGVVMPGMMEHTDMDQLAAVTGAAFDRLFTRMMITHHLGAIEMAGDEEQRGAAPEAKALAVTIKSAQKEEVGRLQKILDRL